MNIAIIGSGPSAFYTIQSFLRENIDIKIDVFEKHPAPYGLVRYGVAPDHQKTKNITRLFSKYLSEDKVKFYGNINIGIDLEVSFLSAIYDAVIISSGSSNDKNLDIVGSNLKGVYGSGEFVGWYNGNPLHEKLNPDFNTKNAVIIGNGNVALDCARVLAKTNKEFYGSDITEYSLNKLQKSKIENIYVTGRRTPKDSKFTIAELRELGQLDNFLPYVNFEKESLEGILRDSGLETKVKKNIEVLLNFKGLNNKEKNKVIFNFLYTPYKINGDNKVDSITFKKNKIVANNLEITDETETIKTNLIISAIGYKVNPIRGIELDPTKSFFANDNGHIKGNIYTNGWAAGASVGVIGSNKIGASILAKKILHETKSKKIKSNEKLLSYLENNNIRYINKTGWSKIEDIENKQASENFLRKKMVNIEEIFQVLSN
ncbi:FAD-dependent oxidoreductase [Alphaproteobacteria bacterium]|nr:FAD-dependent oxidoreductase [Alphaproteobacteria bacterium]